MNCNLLAFVFVATVFTSCNFKNDSDIAKQQIAEVLYQQQDAWNNADLDGYLEGYLHSNELRFVSRRGIMKGFEEVSAMYKRGYKSPAEMGSLSFELREINLLSNEYASIIGFYKLDFKDKKPARGKFTLLLKKTDEGWRIVQDHTS